MLKLVLSLQTWCHFISDDFNGLNIYVVISSIGFIFEIQTAYQDQLPID